MPPMAFQIHVFTESYISPLPLPVTKNVSSENILKKTLPRVIALGLYKSIDLVTKCKLVHVASIDYTHLELYGQGYRARARVSL